jgi:carboxymethylenebutenolidase
MFCGRESHGNLSRMTWLELTADDDHRLSAYRADPPNEPRGALVVLQEIFGVNPHIRRVVDHFAEAGYVTFAPALFDRVETGIELGYDEADVVRGRELAQRLDYHGVIRDIDAAAAAARAVAQARGHTGANVGAVGYCYGGAVAWLVAARSQAFSCAVSYYGSRIVNFVDEAPRVPLMMHVGKLDPSLPLEKVHAIGARYPSIVIHEYDAGHGFSCEERRRDYRAEAAALALDRTLAFFAQHVG